MWYNGKLRDNCPCFRNPYYKEVIMSAFSDWFKDRRAALGLTQSQVASKLGVHQAQISMLEKGKMSPDESLIAKVTAVMGKFEGSYVPIPTAPREKKMMPNKAQEALKAYRESKQGSFNLQLDANTVITADKFQYVLRQGTHCSYFVELKSLLKFLVASQMCQSAVSSVKEILAKLDEVYQKIDERFADYNPANISKDNFEDLEESE